MSKRLKLAQALSEAAHDGQKYGDKDYYETHIIDVVNRVYLKVEQLPETEQEDYLIVAYLHDLLEDTSISSEVIFDLFGETSANAVERISKTFIYNEYGDFVRSKPRDYTDYIRRVRLDNISLLVKICDTESNLDASIADGDQKRINKYRKQLELLLG